MTATIPYTWTIERYHQAIDAGLFVDESLELLRGELIVMPPEREPHAYANIEIGDVLRGLLGQRAKVREAHPITLPNNSEPIPDLAIVQPLGKVYRSRHPGPEDVYWLIEIANTSLSQDLTLKAEIYAEAGIEEYWVVDFNTPELVVMHQPQGREYTSIGRYRSGAISPLVFPELQISVQDLLD
ncbi:MAG: Uma2 family endonuclease [Spirulina sp. SIO3F2]|nr:Uma2 family endonuclease [Spirulina sp. SIO3F2]